MGDLWVNGFSFFHCVASPFHSFVTTQMTSMAGFELLVCPMHSFEGIKCMRGCMLEEHRSKASPKVMAWKGAQATLWMVLGGWDSG